MITPYSTYIFSHPSPTKIMGKYPTPISFLMSNYPIQNIFATDIRYKYTCISTLIYIYIYIYIYIKIKGGSKLYSVILIIIILFL